MRLPSERPDELVHEPRLPDPCLAHDGHEPRPRLGDGFGEGVAQDPELVIPADHRRVEATRALAAVEQAT